MIECVRYKGVNKGSCLGIASIFIPAWGIQINGIGLMKTNGGARWVNLPSKEYLNKEGEKKYMPYFKFREKYHQEAFCMQIKDAIDFWIREHDNGGKQ